MRLSLFCVCLLFSLALSGQVRINEYAIHKELIDNGVASDWIELVNPGTNEVQLSDYFLSDKLDNPLKWNLPAYQLQPGEFLVLAASGLDLTSKIDHWESLVLAEHNWNYFLGNSEPPVDWNETNFDDSSWLSGLGGFGYADGDDNTVINPIASIYIRREFSRF